MSVIHRALLNKFKKSSLGVVFSKLHYSSDSNCIKSAFPDVEIPKLHITELIFNEVHKYSGKIATECGFTGRKYAYDDLFIKSTNLNKSLRKKLKLQKNDVVALFLPNVPEYPICIFGILLAHLKVTTLNPIYSAEEIQRQFLDANVKAIITLPELWPTVKIALSNIKKDLPIITIKTEANSSTPQGAINFQEFIDVSLDIPDVSLASPDETIFMPYSSGTTGLPKGVELTSKNLVANLIQFNAPDVKITVNATDNHQDVTPVVLPLFHIYGFTTTLSMLYTGGKAVTLPKFTPDSYLDALVMHKPQILMVVPPIMIFLYSSPTVKKEYLQSLRSVNCGAAPLGALDEAKFREKVEKPINIIQGYGLTETSPVVSMVPISKQGKYPGSLGHPIPNTKVKVININDPEAKHLGPNETGELLIKGPQVMKGYHNKVEETQNAFLDGWLRTGDLVRYDEDGMFYIADRIKELIKVKGFQVPPAELEEIIRDFPGVADSAVIGIPHEFNGEAPRAYVVPKSGSKIDTKMLQQFVESKVARYKKLSGGIVVVDSIPKNASGKILRRQLKLKYQEEGI